MKQKTAGLYKRTIAWMITSLIYQADVFLLGVVLVALGTTNIYQSFHALVWFLIYALLVKGCIMFFLHPYFVSRFGGDPGKLLTGLKIVNENGEYITYKQAFFREYIGKAMSFGFMGLGLYWITRDKNHQAWHDMAIGTYVEVVNDRNAITGILLIVGLITIYTVMCVTATMNVINNPTLTNEFGGLVKDITMIFQKIDFDAIGKSFSAATTD